MGLLSVNKNRDGRCQSLELDAIPREVTSWDQEAFLRCTSSELTEVERQRVLVPERSFPQQEEILAVHWHPEHVPMDLIVGRMQKLYPNRGDQLIIPTQHNTLMSLGGFAGVEVDCYSRGFKRKVQLLLHFEEAKVREATVLRNMLAHTFKYRSSQLFEYIQTVLDPIFEGRAQRAAGKTNSDEDIVAFTRIHVAKLQQLIENNWAATPKESIKNKLVSNFFEELRALYDDRIVNKAQVFLKAIKEVVKEHFSLTYFYRASEIIEEARSLGAGIVIPHPEQFWPILLADYDVDGIEVWNPQSREYTEFLITAVQRQNRLRGRTDRPVLVFMGDDCHMGEKLKAPELRDPEKGGREVGLQPAWEDLSISKHLIVQGVNRASIIEEYRARLTS
ncbi:hypothetical protein [Desulfocurvibacter africanus]|uniref:Uncharacterized protein n=1 Tax=Desulfocurvibacter africanus subsp. africanus str. Walvis Bay TaxID=690850 RepID=F3YX12_DESAF|nr:hypothetical protein [Desulfocurvibacter africanus]EGJ49400.1 hypothetical protein Desaf_1057 [Desulfocurvibacter africanus subsp. africanus str. Walvis Bay]